jgi:hypothetical protein
VAASCEISKSQVLFGFEVIQSVGSKPVHEIPTKTAKLFSVKLQTSSKGHNGIAH